MALQDWINRFQSFTDRRRRTRDRNIRRVFHQAVDFQPALARLEDRRVLSVSVAVDAGVVAFQADGASDSLSLGVSAEGSLQYSCDGGNHWSTDLDSGTVEIEAWKIAELARIEVLGGVGDSTLTIDFSRGGPIPAGGILFAGGDGEDALRIVGSGLQATYTPDGTTPGAGQLQLAAGQISFTGLTPIDYDVSGGSLTLNLPGGDDLIALANSTLTDGVTPALEISGTSGGTAFESVRVRGSALVIDTTAVAGVDTVTIASADNLHGNSSLRIITGSEAGDCVLVQGTATFSGTVALEAATVYLNAPVTNSLVGSANRVYVAVPGQIQDGIDVAAHGATIHVAAGTYAENLVLAKDNLTLRSTDGAASTILTPSDTMLGGVVIRGDHNTFEGFTIRDFTDDGKESKIIRLDRGADHNTLRDNVLQGNLGQTGVADQTDYGILCYGSYNLIEGNEIYDIGYIGVNVVGGPHAAASGNILRGNQLHDIGIYALALDRSPGNTISQNAVSGLVGGQLWGDFYDPAAWCWGIILWGEMAEGNLITNQTLSGLPNGISLSSAHKTVIEDCDLSGNQGVGLRISKSSWAGGIPTGNVIQHSFIENNQVGILVSGSPGDIGPGNVIHGNRIAGNSVAHLQNVSSALIDASGNWWGTNAPASIAAGLVGQVDWTPWLDIGTDLDSSAAGFQADYTVLHVDDDVPQSAAIGRIGEALALLPGTGGSIRIHDGTYAENVDAVTPGKDVNLTAGSGPARITIEGNLTLSAGDTLSVELAGLNPDTDYDNLVIRGQVVLDGATLTADRETAFVPPNGASFILIDNDGSDPVTGTFEGLAEGSTVILGGIPFSLSYQGGDGNDVVLTIVTPTEVFVDDSWAATPVGTTPATSDPTGLIFQYNAFATIQGGIDRVAEDGSVTVYGGQYAEPVEINKLLQPIRLATNAYTPAETLVEITGAVTLDVDTTFQQEGLTNLAFRSTIDANADADRESLTINGPNTTTFSGTVGELQPLNRLTTDASGTTTINTSTIRGEVLEFNDAVVLGADTTLTGAASVTFQSTLDGNGDGPWDLTITTDAGDILFGNDVGASGGLDELTLVSARDVTAQGSLRAASLWQESGEGTTRFDGLVVVTGPSGIALATDNVVFNQHVTTLDANGPVIVDAAGDIQVNAAIESGLGDVHFTAGGDVQMSAEGQIVTAGAAVEIAAGGQLLMSDGAVVESAAGTIRVSADAGITVGRMVSETPVSLTSADGAIRDGGDAGGADLATPYLALRAAGGIGLGDPLETQVQTIAAENTAGGGIQVANQGPLTIGSVAGLLGLTNSGGGSVMIANQGDLLVSHPVRNAGGGDTDLRVSGGTLTIGATIVNEVAGNLAGGGMRLQADADVVIQADLRTDGGISSGATADRGIILVDAGGTIQLAPGVTIATGTGQMTAAATPDDMPPPVEVLLIPVDQGGSNVNSMGRGFVDVTINDVGENYQITIDWSNGIVTYPPGTSVAHQTRFVAGQTYRFERYYTSNPDPTNASAPIPVHVTIAYDARSQANQPLNGIVFREGGQLLTTTVSDVLTVPGTGLFAAIKVVKSEIVPVALRQAAAAVPIVSPAVHGSQQTSSYEQAMTDMEFAAQTGLRVFFRRVDAAGQEGADVDLPPELIEGGLLEVFQRFPNGRYRVYLKEANSEHERMIQEVNVYQGRIVPPDFREGASERQLENEDQQPQAAPPADVDALDADGDRAERGLESSALENASQANESEGEEPSAEPDAAAVAGRRAASAAGAIGGLGAAGRRSLTTGARLMRRLNMQGRER